MKLKNFFGKKAVESGSNFVSGLAESVVDIAGDVAHNATTKVMDITAEIHKGKIVNATLDTQMHEEKLLKLKSLFEKGLLNQTEYESEKADVLSKW